jgi:hypothetical protein
VSQRIKGKVKKRRGAIYLWILGLIVVVGALIYFEQTAMLYVFSTLGVTVLLVIVAIADLGEHEHVSAETEPAAPAVRGKK